MVFRRHLIASQLVFSSPDNRELNTRETRTVGTESEKVFESLMNGV